MKTTNILFTRIDKTFIDAISLVEFKHEDGLTEDGILKVFDRALSDWMNKTVEGRAAYDESCGDFNIGDFAHHEDTPSLIDYLNKYNLSANIINCKASTHRSYDTVISTDVKE
ncbi:hypothetical protein AB6D11_02645 [Vibrio splendidus]